MKRQYSKNAIAPNPLMDEAMKVHSSPRNVELKMRPLGITIPKGLLKQADEIIQ